MGTSKIIYGMSQFPNGLRRRRWWRGPAGPQRPGRRGDGGGQLGGSARLGSARPGSASRPPPCVVRGVPGPAPPARWWALAWRAVLGARPQVMFLGSGKQKGPRVRWQPQRVPRCVLLNKTRCSRTRR